MQKSTDPGGLRSWIWIAAAFVAAAIVFIDQWTKQHFAANGPDFQQPIIPGFLDLIYHENHGIVANVPLPNILTISLTIIVMIAVLYGMHRSSGDRRRIIEVIALAELFGGAMGNLIDRMTQGYVFDWILLFNRSAINIADIAIIEGAFVYILWRWFIKTQEKKTIVMPVTEHPHS
ncbi:hypothetical protein GF380_03410 [Candidatus Uhrbacteria bacterium]|nr:hypothetical protein [Candidatus Uhrbacteria bacterium]MBD3284180.1 hypothetical protein [Candidatus Uhrbacteria bacterium]